MSFSGTNGAGGSLNDGRIVLRPDQMYAVVEHVTAEHAQRILDEAEQGTETLRQRRPSLAVISEFVDIINTGQWMPVPPGIVYDTENRIINGGQRLRAQVKTGKTLPWWVTYNCPPEVFPLLDTHKKRTIGDALYMAGAVDTAAIGAHLGSALRLLACWEQAQADPDGMKNWPSWSKLRINNAALLKVLALHPNMGESVTLAHRVRSVSGYNVASTAVWHRLLCDLHPASHEHALAFIDQFAYGRMIDKGMPAYALSRWTAKGMPIGGEYRQRIAREVALFALIQAWNEYARHRELTAITVSTKKPMPTPVKWLPPRPNGGSGRA